MALEVPDDEAVGARIDDERRGVHKPASSGITIRGQGDVAEQPPRPRVEHAYHLDWETDTQDE